MSMQVNKTVVERYGELWNSGDVAIVDELLTDDFVLCNPEGGETAGRTAFKAGVAHHHDTMTRFSVSIDRVVAEGDVVAIRFTAHGSHTGPFLSSTPSGKLLTWTGMQLLHFRDGRISRIWHQPDDLSVLRQLGLVQEKALANG